MTKHSGKRKESDDMTFITFMIYSYIVSAIFCAVSLVRYLHRGVQSAIKRYTREEAKIICRSVHKISWLDILLVFMICMLPVVNLAVGLYAVSDRAVKDMMKEYDSYFKKGK